MEKYGAVQIWFGEVVLLCVSWSFSWALICTTTLPFAANAPIHTKTHLEVWQVGQLGIVLAM